MENILICGTIEFVIVKICVSQLMKEHTPYRVIVISCTVLS